MSRFDWPALLKTGLVTLRLTPADFWALTPYELTVMLGKDMSAPPLSRARLDELARAFPDEPKKDGDG